MKIKQLQSTYNKETGDSTVTIYTKYGVFCGDAKCHPDDMPSSRFFGCAIAEYRAKIKALQKKKELLSARVKEVKYFMDRLDDKCVKARYFYLKAEIQRLNIMIHELKFCIKNSELIRNNKGEK